MPRVSPEAFLARVSEALAPRFMVVRELGRGGMASVFLAHDVHDGSQVAIKVLHPELTGILGPERFHQEIQILRRLRHPNIVPLLESNESPPLLYFTAPYMTGESLRALIHRLGPLPLSLVVELTGGIAAALDHAHRENVLHRDIKPENVLLEGGKPLVCDFGVARAIERAAGDRISSSGLIIGTPEYMSPEQAAGETALDHRSDIYGLACVVYELLAGEQPFSGHSAQAVMARQMTAQPRSIRVVRPEVPPPMEAAVMRALAKQPADRPQTARRLFEQLRAGAGQTV